VEYFVYGRDNPGTAALRAELGERHWSFMDAYDDRLVARGPTYTDDGMKPTGSMHIVEVRDPEEARQFAFEEPYCQAGVFSEVIVRRWQNVLGGTMWENAVDGLDSDRVLVIAHGAPDADGASQAGFAAGHPYRDHLVVMWPLVSDDGSAWLGNVLALERVERRAVEEMVKLDPYARAGLYDRVEIHRWYFGGRR